MSELFWMEANTVRVVPVAQRGENEGGWWRKSLGYSLILVITEQLCRFGTLGVVAEG